MKTSSENERRLQDVFIKKNVCWIVFLRIRKRSSLIRVWLGRKSWKRAEAMEKSIHELKAEFVYLILWEKKINNLEITVIILKVFKKCKSLMPLIHGQIYLIKLIWHIFWIKKWQYQIQCIHDQISLKQTNQIGFKEMGHFDTLASSSPAPLCCCPKMFLSLLESNVRRLIIFPFTSFFWKKI